ncbi:MAG TPA: hypothetical protein VJK04_03815 [Candidatus Paceibacterota bacterium]
MTTDTRKTIDDIIAIKEVAAACKLLGPILSAVKAGREVADAIVVPAQEMWRSLREEGSPLSRNEFTVLQGRLLVPCVTRENRYPEAMSKALIVVVTHNPGFIWAVVEDTQEALIALPKWEIRSVTPWDSRKLVEVFDKEAARAEAKTSHVESDVVDVLADASKAVVTATGQRLAALRRFAGLVPRAKKEDDSDGGEMNDLAATQIEIEAKKEEITVVNTRIVELLKVGAKVDVTVLAAAQTELVKVEGELAALEAELAKAESGKVVPPTPDASKALDEVDDAGGEEEDEFELFAVEVRASALTTDEQEDLLDLGLGDLTAAQAKFAEAKKPEPELTLEQAFEAEVAQSPLGAATKDALVKLTRRGLHIAREAFVKAVTKKAKRAAEK